MKTQLANRTLQMLAIRLTKRCRGAGEPVSVILNCPVIGKRQCVEPTSDLRLQLDVVPVPHIHEYIARRRALAKMLASAS
jgi:hypothetical protein